MCLGVPGKVVETYLRARGADGLIRPWTCRCRAALDFHVAATKYFAALENSDVPLSFLFSGTVFYPDEEMRLQVSQIPWNKEAVFRLPVQVWQDLMARYYPNSAWLCLRRDAFDRLYEYKRQRGLPTWEQALEELWSAAESRCTP
jgi:hypothetical protein